MNGSHDSLLVVLSIVLAVLASYTALDLAGRVAVAAGRRRYAWIGGGALAMGFGIWSMHFTAMLAYNLPVPIRYGWGLTVLSLGIAIGVSAVALGMMGRERVPPAALLGAGLGLGVAIAGMHYTGMAAVQVSGTLRYDPLPVAASVAIALVAAVAALWLLLHFRFRTGVRAAWGKAASAGVMGVAITGLHYTAMAAVTFVPAPGAAEIAAADVLARSELAVAVVVGTLVVLALARLAVVAGREVRPLQVMAGSGVLAGLLFAVLGWAVWGMYDSFRGLEAEAFFLQRRIDRVDYLDEALTMSTQMAAASGNPVWETRYRRLDDELSAQLPEIVRWAESAAPDATAVRLRASSDTLLALEDRVFALVRQGRRDEALALLAGPQYTRQKRSYLEAAAAVKRAVHEHATATRDQFSRRIALVALLVAVILATLALAGLFLRRAILAYAAQRNRDGEALRRQEAHFRSLIENTSDIITILDADGKVVYESPAIRRILGYEPEDLVGRGTFELVHPDDLAAVRESFDRALREPEVARTTVYRFRHRDGSWRFLETTGSNRLEDPAVRGIIRVSRDVTERVGAEEEAMEHARSSELSFDVGRLVTAGFPLDEMLEHCSQAVLNYVGAAFVRIWTLNEDEQVLELRASAGMYTHLDGPHGRVPVGQFKIGRIAEERKPHLTNDVPHDPRVGDPEWARREGMQAFAGYPLLVGDQVIGVIALFARDPLPPSVLGTLESVSDRIAIAVERTRAEAELQRKERRFRGMIENASDLITLLDAGGRILYESPAVERILGYGAEELVGRNAFELIHPDDAPRVLEVFGRGVQDPTYRVGVEYRFRHRDGSWRVLESIGNNLLGDPLIGAFVANSRDVTERRVVEAANRRLAAIVESSEDAIVSKTFDGTITSWNTAAERLYGYTAEEMLGRSVFLLVPEDEHTTEREILQRVALGERVASLETVRLRKDGRPMHVSISVSPVTDDEGRVVAISGIARDISDRKRAEEELIRAKEAAEEANRAKSEFLSSMSHELRTPLNSVIGFANVLRKNKVGNLREQDLGYLDRIGSNGKHLLGLINDILDLSKIEAGKMELETGPVALGELVLGTLDELKGAVRGREVELRALVPEELATLDTDAGRLKQVLINLVGNALKFTERGNVTVAVVADPATRRPARIDVRDTGVGIPAERLSAIFRAFEQAESGTARRFGGTGLGLTISTSLCELMGYRLEVASEPGVGSLFSIVLVPGGEAAPAPEKGATALPASAPPVPPAFPGEGELRSKLVLVIDDETDSRMLLTHHLEEFGCSTITASSGEQGLRMAREFRPDLITLDLLLPGMTGWEILRALKADPELRDVPVVVVSVVAGENRGSVLGAVELVDKPIGRDALLAALHRCLGPLARPRVLIVDDEEDARDLLSTYLVETGAEIRTAANGREALRALESFAPDLIVLDLWMPGMDGTELLGILYESEAHRRVPVVVVTARDPGADQLRNVSREVLAVLGKDAELEADLRAVVRQICERSARVPAAAANGWLGEV